MAPSSDGEGGPPAPGAGGLWLGRGSLYFDRKQKPVLDGTLQSQQWDLTGALTLELD